MLKEWIIRENLSQMFNNTPHVNRLRGRPKSIWWNCVQADINRRKIKT